MLVGRVTGMRRQTKFVLYLLGSGLLLLAWVFGNPPGAAPDEPSHYVRAMGAGQGVIFGGADPYPSFRNFNHAVEAPPDELRNLNAYVRGYPVPAGLAPTTFACNAFEPRVSSQCESARVTSPPAGVERSQHAGQPPLPYLLAGPVMVELHSPDAADRAGRGILAGFCLLLLAVPLSMTRRFRVRALLGLVVALTPMAFFTGAIFNPSGIETFSSIGFFLALLAVAEGRFPRGALVAAGFTGEFLAMSPWWARKCCGGGYDGSLSAAASRRGWPLGIGPQGRHFLPILVLQPLTSVLVLARQRPLVRWLAVGLPALGMAGLQLVAWISNGSRQALGTPAPPLSRLPELTKALLQYPSWSPPGGYLPWLCAAVTGCALLLVAAAGSLAESPP